MSWLDTVIYGVRRIFAAGTEQPAQDALNFAAPIVVADDPGNERTNVSIPASSSSTAGTTPATTGADKVLCAPANVPTWAKIADANVDAAAAIVGTKVAPNFGSQAVSTTGAGTFATLNAGTAPFAATGQIRLPASPSIHAVRVAGGTVELFTVTTDQVVTGAGSSLYTIESDGQIRVDSANSVRLQYNGADKVIVSSGDVTISHDGVQLNSSSSIELQFEDSTLFSVAEAVRIHNLGNVPPAEAGVAVVAAHSGALKAVGAGGAVHTLCPSGLAGWSYDKQDFETTVPLNTTASLWTLTPGTGDQEVIVKWTVAARDTGSDVAVYAGRAGFKVRSSTLAIVGAAANVLVAENDGTWNVTADASGGDVRLRGTADATLNTTFTGTVEIWRRQ